MSSVVCDLLFLAVKHEISKEARTASVELLSSLSSAVSAFGAIFIQSILAAYSQAMHSMLNAC